MSDKTSQYFNFPLCRVAEYIPPRPLFPKRTDGAQRVNQLYFSILSICKVIQYQMSCHNHLLMFIMRNIFLNVQMFLYWYLQFSVLRVMSLYLIWIMHTISLKKINFIKVHDQYNKIIDIILPSISELFYVS